MAGKTQNQKQAVRHQSKQGNSYSKRVYQVQKNGQKHRRVNPNRMQKSKKNRETVNSNEQLHGKLNKLSEASQTLNGKKSLHVYECVR